tara:strand:- start:249 stop:767 length:519 start_codon:yes stop_codon:yes gene_type:complete
MDTTISIIFFVVGIFAFSYFLEVITKGKYLPTKEENEILLLCVTIPLLSILIWVQFDNFHLMSWSYLIGFTIVSSIVLDVVTHYITIFLAKFFIKSKSEEMDVKEIMDGILQEGRTIKDHGTGIYFKVVGKKLHTSYPIHTEAGGDPDVYWAWEKAQKGSDTYPPEDYPPED